MGWWWLLILPVGLIVVGFSALQLWFLVLRWLDAKAEHHLVADLTRRRIPKLSIEEQFKFLDGHWDFTKMKGLLGGDTFDLAALSYFIDVEPEVYLKHLRANHPPASWMTDAYEEVCVECEAGKWKLINLHRGQRYAAQEFASYDHLLRHLVKDRLMNVSRAHKSRLQRSVLFR